MRLKVFRVSSLVLYSISFLCSVALFVFSIIYNDSEFYLAPIGCALEILVSLLLLVMSFKNLNKNTCMLVDLAFEKNMSKNKVAFIGSIVLMIIGIALLVGGILLLTLVNQYSIAFPLLALANLIIFNIIVFYIYMYVEIHY